MPTNSPTSTEPVIEPLARAMCAANFAVKGGEGEFGTVDDCWWSFKDDARRWVEALSRTPADSEVERVARAMTDERTRIMQEKHGVEWIGWDEYDEQGKEDARREARAAITALPPKPVDGEVAELVGQLRDFFERHIESDADHTLYNRVALALALSRNTEPMVTDAEPDVIEELAVAISRADNDKGYEYDRLGIDHPEVSDWSIHLALAVINVLPGLSTRKKGTDDAR